jgi:hypothetical protein
LSNILIDEGSPFCYYPREKDSLKMKIANFRDYVNVLREVYSRENMDELGNYYRALMASGSALKKQKALLQKDKPKTKKLPVWRWRNFAAKNRNRSSV